MPDDTQPDKPMIPSPFPSDLARFGQWAIILGVLVWVLQVFTGTLERTEEANRQERTEMRELYHRTMDDRLDSLERIKTAPRLPAEAITTP